jgi:hypothetical protein
MGLKVNNGCDLVTQADAFVCKLNKHIRLNKESRQIKEGVERLSPIPTTRKLKVDHNVFLG